MKRAFTLVEVLVVVAIIAVLVGMTVFGGARYISHAKRAKIDAELVRIGVALDQWRHDNGGIPVPSATGDIGALADALIMAGPAWIDGMDGAGGKDHCSWVDTPTGTDAAGNPIGDGVIDARSIAGKLSNPLITNSVLSVTDDTAPMELRFQSTVQSQDGCPILYVPLAKGKVIGSLAYIGLDKAAHAYPVAYVTGKIAGGDAYLLIHPGEDRQFDLPGGAGDDVVYHGR